MTATDDPLRDDGSDLSEGLTPDSDRDEPGPNAFQFQFPDAMLQALVGSMERRGGDVRVVMSVRGQTVVGSVISPQTWATRIDAALARSTPMLDAGEGSFRAELQADDWSELSHIDWLRTVHLADATVGGLPVGLWRCRLIDVAGWTIAGTESA